MGIDSFFSFYCESKMTRNDWIKLHSLFILDWVTSRGRRQCTAPGMFFQYLITLSVRNVSY